MLQATTNTYYMCPLPTHLHEHDDYITMREM